MGKRASYLAENGHVADLPKTLKIRTSGKALPYWAAGKESTLAGYPRFPISGRV